MSMDRQALRGTAYGTHGGTYGKHNKYQPHSGINDLPVPKCCFAWGLNLILNYFEQQRW